MLEGMMCKKRNGESYENYNKLVEKGLKVERLWNNKNISSIMNIFLDLKNL